MEKSELNKCESGAFLRLQNISVKFDDDMILDNLSLDINIYEREEIPFENMGRDPRDNRPRYEDVDFEERAKQEHLDSLYDDDYDDDDFGGKGKLAIILGIVGLILIIFLIFRTVSLGSKLEDAQNQLTQSQDYKEKYEEIQLEKMQLEEQLDAIQNPDANADNADEDAEMTMVFTTFSRVFGQTRIDGRIYG